LHGAAKQVLLLETVTGLCSELLQTRQSSLHDTLPQRNQIFTGMYWFDRSAHQLAAH
jgi:hypothetical protein